MIRHARFPDDGEAVLDIWREYVASPSVSLAYQDHEAEFASLPGKYAAPEGRLLLAERRGGIVGCIALRRVSGAICEMKRLYVRRMRGGRGSASAGRATDRGSQAGRMSRDAAGWAVARRKTPLVTPGFRLPPG